jgi:D-alanine-D-alanine ligase
VAPATGILNEIDTIPGFTSIGMYPQIWERSGTGFGALLDRHRKKKETRFTP